MQDFAEGTSSRSTKLVHGGLRYLKQFDVEVVSDAVSERAVVQQIAHIFQKQIQCSCQFTMNGATFSLFVSVAMDLYDLWQVVTCMATNRCWAEEVLEPNLKKEGLVGGGGYLDFHVTTIWRLVIENIERASQDGASLPTTLRQKASLTKAVELLVLAHWFVDRPSLWNQARLVINTTGPWSDKVHQCPLIKRN